VGDRLPWPDDASASEAKGPFDAGAIHYGGSRQECSIQKISALGATLRSELALNPGDQVAVELETGQRAAGTIAWARRGDLGVCFNDRVDVLPLLNRKLVSQPVERRSMPRVEVRYAVYLKSGGNLLPATMRNISARGLQLEGEDLPPCGTYVSVFVEGLNVPPGEVVWRRDNLAGVEVFEELNWTSLIPWIRNAIRKA
jgi:hypothetical protein